MATPEIPAIDSARFRQVLGHFTTGVTVITGVSPEGPVGLAVGSFMSLSLEPPLVVFCPARSSSSWPRIEPSGHFCVNILAEDQEEVCRVFASKDLDKFSAIGWTPGGSGSPVIHGSLAHIDCAIDAIHDGGDHVIVVGRVLELEVDREAGPLVFYRGGYGRFDV